MAIPPKKLLKFEDFEEILAAAGDTLPVIGGQAVAWWADRYLADSVEAVTGSKYAGSVDIDFWADRDEMEGLARKLHVQPRYPHKYEMTALSGICSTLSSKGVTLIIEFLHTVPGLDIPDPANASIQQANRQTKIRVLDPISLLHAKLHALRNFNQEERQDALHLKICHAAIPIFIEEVLARDTSKALFYIERVLKAATRSFNIKVSEGLGLDLLKAIPISAIQNAANNATSPTDKEKLNNFLSARWKRLSLAD
jgi:hypothetical protein